MKPIERDPKSAARTKFDLIIVGGGIYGVMLALEASRRGIRCLLLEKDDFGTHTSFNSLRIVHGGLRYLQSMDLSRFKESVGERRWFLQNFPNHVKVLPCLMPLYGQGMHRPAVLRTALWINDLLSGRRNTGVRPERHLPSGRIIDKAETIRMFPAVMQTGLKGAAIWYDACMPDSQRLLMDTLRWAVDLGTVALNYIEVSDLIRSKDGTHVVGVVARDTEDGAELKFQAQRVINAAGPWSRELAGIFHRDEAKLFKPMLLWNVLLDKPAPAKCAVAVSKQGNKGRSYFLVPWKGKLFAGTGQKAWYGPVNIEGGPMPSEAQLDEFLEDINTAVPGLDAGVDHILYITAGLLPAKRVASDRLAVREVIHNHAQDGGPVGLWSVSGVKFTTARLVAQKTLQKVFPERRKEGVLRQPEFGHGYSGGIFDFQWEPSQDNGSWKNDIQTIIKAESVVHLDDLIFRRTNIWDNPTRALKTAAMLGDLFGWDDARSRRELDNITQIINRKHKPSYRQPGYSQTIKECR